MDVNIIFGVIGGILLLVSIAGGILYERYRKNKGFKKEGSNLFERVTKQFNDDNAKQERKKVEKAQKLLTKKKSFDKNEKLGSEFKLKNDLEDREKQSKKYQVIIDNDKVIKKL